MRYTTDYIGLALDGQRCCFYVAKASRGYTIKIRPAYTAYFNADLTDTYLANIRQYFDQQ